MKLKDITFSSDGKTLLALGFLGLFLYLYLLPVINHDAAVQFEISQEEAIEQAKSFARAQGQNISGLTWSARPMRAVGILDSLLTPAAIRQIDYHAGDAAFSALPAYFWQVTGIPESEEEDKPKDLVLRLTTHGDIWEYRSDPSITFNTVFADAIKEIPLVTSDSTALALDDENIQLLWNISNNLKVTSTSDSLQLGLLTAEDARAMVRYHLHGTVLQHYQEISIDTVLQAKEPAGVIARAKLNAIARVHLEAVEPASGIPVDAYMDVSNTGHLVGLITSFSSEYEKLEESQNENGPPGRPPDQQDGPDISFEASDIPILLSVLVYFLLGIFILVLFLRRLNARLIDVKSALQDAIWGGLFAAAYTVNMVTWNIFNGSNSLGIEILLSLGLVLFAGSGGAFVVFILSSATDSISRVIWPEKLSSLTLARNARFISQSTGYAILIAAGFAGLCLGISALFIFIPGFDLSFAGESENLPGHRVLSPLLGILSMSGWKGLLITMGLLLGLGTTIYSKRPSRPLLLISLTVLGALVELGPVSVQPFYAQWALSAILAFTLGVIFLRFDFMSAFLGYMVFSILWELAPSWYLSVSEARLDAIIAFALIPGMLALGFLGIRQKKQEDDASQFMPAYLRDMAKQERLQGELDIAKQVQASLLPRRMPDVKGLDIAAMCLPAEEVGGDYFDFIRLDANRLAIVIGDVSGKGIQAAFYMTLTKGFIHSICEEEPSPAALLTRVNRLFCKNVSRGSFISLIYGVLDSQAQTFTFARAGHDPLLYRTAAGKAATFLKPPGLAIGLTPTSTFEETIQDTVVHLSPDDVLVFYTDGVTEAMNPAKELFGSERLAKEVDNSSMPMARQILDNVSNYIHMFMSSAARHDDMTMIILRFAAVHEMPSGSIISASESPSWLQQHSQSTN